MKIYLNIFGLTIPSYGFFIALGVILANLVAYIVLKKKTKQSFDDFIIIEGYCLLGAFIGAKLLYIIVSFKSIDWSRIFEPEYFSYMMLSGFVFYGGLIVGLAFVFLAGKIHKINAFAYAKNFIFLIPIIHGFGRVGCFMAGCCYGRPHDGVLGVVFPEGSFAPSGVKLFPVQLVEAVCLLFIAAIILYLQLKKDSPYTVEVYLILYAILRFILEYFRYDEVRGIYAGMSTSQWISIALLATGMVSVVLRKRKSVSTKSV